jgi:hypothetical protein
VLTRRHPRYKGGVLSLNYGGENGGLSRECSALSALRKPCVADYAYRPKEMVGRAVILTRDPRIMSPAL